MTGYDEYNRQETINLVKRGTCFIAYEIEKELRFAPSRFIGYKSNKIDRHLNAYKDGRETNKAINDVLGSKPIPNDSLNKKYISYCRSLGIEPNETGAFGVQRKFWTLKISEEFESNAELTGEFPEGKIVERTHKVRERNSKVIQVAKDNFKKKHGRLFCQVCGFDFGKVYGEVGENFIEGHHTIAVSEMSSDYKTKPDDIAMLCSNCHRMVHKKRPWLSMQELSKLLK